VKTYGKQIFSLFWICLGKIQDRLVIQMIIVVVGNENAIKVNIFLDHFIHCELRRTIPFWTCVLRWSTALRKYGIGQDTAAFNLYEN
jgi:hypothetical protein